MNHKSFHYVYILIKYLLLPLNKYIFHYMYYLVYDVFINGC